MSFFTSWKRKFLQTGLTKIPLHLDVEAKRSGKQERWICPSLAVGRKRIFLWMFLIRRRVVQQSPTMMSPIRWPRNSESVSFMKIFVGDKISEPKGIPSQQLPSFMFLSWSWVLWKILHINVIYDATCSFSVACIFSWTKFHPFVDEFYICGYSSMGFPIFHESLSVNKSFALSVHPNLELTKYLELQNHCVTLYITSLS